MKTRVQSIHYTADVKLLDFIQKKADKLDQFFDQIISGEVYLKLENTDDEANKITEIKLLIPGYDLFAKEQCKTFEEATIATEKRMAQSSKAISMGIWANGLAHEINNPINFIYGNLHHTNEYTETLLQMLQIYAKNYPEPRAEQAPAHEAEQHPSQHRKAGLDGQLDQLHLGHLQHRPTVTEQV